MAEWLPALPHVNDAVTPPPPLQGMSNDHSTEGILHMISRGDNSRVINLARNLYPEGCKLAKGNCS